jgi:hypothetical protein
MENNLGKKQREIWLNLILNCIIHSVPKELTLFSALVPQKLTLFKLRKTLCALYETTISLARLYYSCILSGRFTQHRYYIYLFKINFNMFLLSILRSCKKFLFLIFSTEISYEFQTSLICVSCPAMLFCKEKTHNTKIKQYLV